MHKIVRLAASKKKKKKASSKSPKRGGLAASPKQRRKSTFQELKEKKELLKKQKEELNEVTIEQAKEEEEEEVEEINPNNEIHRICHSGTVEELQEFLNKHNNYTPNYVKPLWNGSSALHMAAYRSDNEMIKLLLRKGWSANFKDDRGETPLHWVCQHSGREDLKDTRILRNRRITQLNKLKTG
jgi:hypothetical protein